MIARNRWWLLAVLFAATTGVIAGSIVCLILTDDDGKSEYFQAYESALDTLTQEYVAPTTEAIALSQGGCSFATLSGQQKTCGTLVEAIERAQPDLDLAIDEFDQLVRNPDPQIGSAIYILVDLRDTLLRFRGADELIIEGWSHQNNAAWQSGWGERLAAAADLQAIVGPP